MNTKKTILTIIVIVIIIAVPATLMVIHHKKSIFRYEDHLDDTVVSVDDRDVTLREFGYYIYEVEAFVQDQALIYDSDNPKKWWNTHFSAGLDSTFICDYAEKVAVNTLICDEIYYKEATRQGMSLNDEEKARAAKEAKDMYGKMDKYQRDVTGLDEKTIAGIKEKHALAFQYAEYLVGAGDFSRYSGDPHDLLNWDGQYYQELIMPGHTITENEALLDKITLGNITVNY